MRAALERAWRDGGALPVLLAPLAALYGAMSERRAAGYRDGRLAVEPSALPVVVIGNLTVGGTGKTPLTAHLVEAFRARGWRPGIVSRGHGGERHEKATLVSATDPADRVGDEPLMLCRRTGAPVCVCVHRARAVARLAADTDCDLVLSDDGLQHGAMARDAEIVVVDAAYGFGNGRLLPAGPLRERPERLCRATLLAVRRESTRPGGHRAEERTSRRTGERTGGEAADGGAGGRREAGGASVAGECDRTGGPGPLAGVPGAASLDGTPLPPAFDFATGEASVRRWPDGPWASLDAFAGRAAHAVAGIARPERFFETLRGHGLSVTAHPFPDHHAFRNDDLRFGDALPILVTAKDAVKLDALDEPLAGEIHEVAVELRTGPAFEALIDALSDALSDARPNGRPDRRPGRRLGRTPPPPSPA